MPDPNEIRLVLSVRAWNELRQAYKRWDSEEVHRQLNARMRLGRDDLFSVVAYPSNIPPPAGLDISRDELLEFLVFGIVIHGGQEAAEVFANGVTRENFGPDASVGADLVVNPAHDPFSTHWCPNEAGDGLMGDRAAALRTIRANPSLLTAAGLPGPEQVNIVFVDTGLPLRLLPAGSFKGWPVLENAAHSGAVRLPGNPLTSHGEMVARNARAVALAAAPPAKLRLLDCPVIPDGITRFPIFLSSVAAALFSIFSTIATGARKAEGWVICNAWAVFDPTVKPGQAGYANNPDHPIAIALRLLNDTGADLVFAAGNCGQFCPNPRCSPDFTGPSRGINGANALREVLTVGAVRNDRVWLGYSGQGPGIAGMANNKPDICAPSQFASDDHPGSNTGTSAACGLAVGAVALLRTKWPSGRLMPDTLACAIRHNADQPYGPADWQQRTGHGILDLAATAADLNQRFPPEARRSAVRRSRAH